MPQDLLNLENEVCLITGASSGIGAMLARGFAAAGGKVVLAARRRERLDALAAEIKANGGQALTLALDVTDRLAIPAAFASIEQHFGAATVLVNNAGIAEAMRFTNTPRDSLDRVMGTNFFAAWDLTQEFAQRLCSAKRGGNVLNIGSVLGIGAGSGYSAYAAAKAALTHLTRCLAIEFVPLGIRVNALAPGWFVTEMNQEYFASVKGSEYAKRIPPGRTGNLAELLGPALLLTSRAGSYVNGVVLAVDGGHSVTCLAMR